MNLDFAWLSQYSIIVLVRTKSRGEMFSEKILGTVGLQGSHNSRDFGNGHVTVARPVMVNNHSLNEACGTKNQALFRDRLFYH